MFDDIQLAYNDSVALGDHLVEMYHVGPWLMP